MQAASDAALIGREVDGVLLVVQPSENHRRVVIRSVEALRAMKINLVGVVTNRVAAEKGSGYYEEGYGYGLGYGCGSGYGADCDDGGDDGVIRETVKLIPEQRIITPVRRRAA
jgi:Mrp family chromosome partitioning ATPase